MWIYGIRITFVLIDCFASPGTSIGFKNIASKIAYDLRLWLDSKRTTQQPFPAQQSKSLDYDHQPEPSNSNVGITAQVRPSASVGLTASVLAEQNEEDDEIYGEATDETSEPETIIMAPVAADKPQQPSIPIAIPLNAKKQCSTTNNAMIDAPRTTDSGTRNPSPLPTELIADDTTTTQQKQQPSPPSNEPNEPNDHPDNSNSSSNNANASNNASTVTDADKPDSSNIQLGYNNMIASLLRTTTL